MDCIGQFCTILHHFEIFGRIFDTCWSFWTISIIFGQILWYFGHIHWYFGQIQRNLGKLGGRFCKFSGIFFGKYSGILEKFKWTYFWIGPVTTFKRWHDFVMLRIHKKEDNLNFVGYFHIIQLCKQIMNQTK